MILVFVLFGVVALAALVLVLVGKPVDTPGLFSEARRAHLAGDRAGALQALELAFGALFDRQLTPSEVGQAIDGLSLAQEVIGWEPHQPSWQHWRRTLEALRGTGGAVQGYLLAPFFFRLRVAPLLAVVEGMAPEAMLDAVRALLSKGAAVDGGDVTGGRPLLEAAAGGHLEVVKCLVEHGADVNHRGWTYTPLAIAQENGHEAVADFLRSKGARAFDAEAPENLHAVTRLPLGTCVVDLRHLACELVVDASSLFPRLRDEVAAAGPGSLLVWVIPVPCFVHPEQVAGFIRELSGALPGKPVVSTAVLAGVGPGSDALAKLLQALGLTVFAIALDEEVPVKEVIISGQMIRAMTGKPLV